MTSVRLWNIQSNKPLQLNRSAVSLEKHLEEWIEHDPALVNPDLLIVGRQVHVEGGIIDLLALDRLGNYWSIIEVKKGNVRRDTITQALDYAACIHELSDAELQKIVETYLRVKGQTLRQMMKDNHLDATIFDKANRNLVIYVVGTGRDAHLERMANYLRNAGNQINVVTFDVFDDASGHQTLLREMEELESQVPPKTTTQPAAAERPDTDLEQLIATANKNGIGESFQIIYEAAVRHGMFPRLYSQSVMFAPPTDKRRCLIFAPVVRKAGKYVFYFVPETFEEFYRVSTIRTLAVLGTGGYWEATPENARKFANRLDKLFKIVASNTKDES